MSEKTTKTMACVRCGRAKAWPDAFPSSMFAECWECAWNEHVRAKHPEVVRRIKRAARKRARRLTERDVTNAMFESERLQVLGGSRAARVAAKGNDEEGLG